MNIYPSNRNEQYLSELINQNADVIEKTNKIIELIEATFKETEDLKKQRKTNRILFTVSFFVNAFLLAFILWQSQL